MPGQKVKYKKQVSRCGGQDSWAQWKLRCPPGSPSANLTQGNLGRALLPTCDVSSPRIMLLRFSHCTSPLPNDHFTAVLSSIYWTWSWKKPKQGCSQPLTESMQSFYICNKWSVSFSFKSKDEKQTHLLKSFFFFESSHIGCLNHVITSYPHDYRMFSTPPNNPPTVTIWPLKVPVHWEGRLHPLCSQFWEELIVSAP